MQIGGESYRVELIEDLTRYDKRLIKGQLGMTMPGVKLSVWGSSDRFVAVRFDCGAELDILFQSLRRV
jgi:hypothetical protein